jgi:hypothetical protein
MEKNEENYENLSTSNTNQKVLSTREINQINSVFMNNTIDKENKTQGNSDERKGLKLFGNLNT